MAGRSRERKAATTALSGRVLRRLASDIVRFELWYSRSLDFIKRTRGRRRKRAADSVLQDLAVRLESEYTLTQRISGSPFWLILEGSRMRRLQNSWILVL